MTIELPLARQDLAWQVTRNENPTSAEERAEILRDPVFGQRFTDHMVELCWSERGGWHRPRVLPYGPIQLEPGAAVLHYAQEIFEGLKVYRYADGTLRSFRPDQNALRFERSAKRLAMPELPPEYFMESLRQLVALDGDWVPTEPETSLYIRPYMYAKESFLGVRPSAKYDYRVIASPSGPYFATGVAPVDIWLSDHWTRAGRGGVGYAKTGANYAASLLPQMEAKAEGCAQVLYLDAQSGEYIEEVGVMNVALLTKDRHVITPVSDTILEGIIVKSVLQLARDRGYTTEERPIRLSEWVDGVASGEIVEAFAAGTAAVITPIRTLKNHTMRLDMPEVPDSLAMSLREELVGIQYGHIEDRHGWMTRLDG